MALEQGAIITALITTVTFNQKSTATLVETMDQ
jgi:hypothetical protein